MLRFVNNIPVIRFSVFVVFITIAMIKAQLMLER